MPLVALPGVKQADVGVGGPLRLAGRGGVALDRRHLDLLFGPSTEDWNSACMTPAGAPPEKPLVDQDAFDLPVVVRRSTPLAPLRRPGQRRLNDATLPWPGGVPGTTGDYVTTMTWRNLLDAALTVGRDVAPWLLWSPGLAWQEVVARESPLRAFLVRVSSPLLSSPTGWALQPSVVYTKGTERTAQAAFGYRLGMTVTEWVARGLCGLGATTHCEADVPGGAPTGWAALRSQPDLFCVDASGGTWLLEAKGGRRLGLPELRKGATQVETAAKGFAPPTTNAVVGASLEHVLYATLDVDDAPTPSPLGAAGAVVTDEQALLAAVRSRMLAYAVLLGAPSSRLSLRIAAGAAAADPKTAASPLTSLEKDGQTEAARSDRAGAPDEWRQSFGQVTEYLVASVPETGVALGLSREMYSACASYADQAKEIDMAAEELLPLLPPDQELELPDFEMRQQQKDELLAQIRDERKHVLMRTVLTSFERAKGVSWERITQRAVTYDDEGATPEAANSVAYLAARAPF